jgi:hypothetical protein
MGQMKNESKNFARKPLGKKPLAKPKHRQEWKTKMDIEVNSKQESADWDLSERTWTFRFHNVRLAKQHLTSQETTALYRLPPN